MDKIGIPDKVNFHKQAYEILYSDLLKSYLNKNKLEAKVIKLEEQIKREKVASKGWKTQVKKLETYLVNLGSKPNEKKSNKKLIDEKDKLIESLQKKLKGFVTDHPQTQDIVGLLSADPSSDLVTATKTPKGHRPTRQQTAQQPKVSPEVTMGDMWT